MKNKKMTIVVFAVALCLFVAVGCAPVPESTEIGDIKKAKSNIESQSNESLIEDGTEVAKVLQMMPERLQNTIEENGTVLKIDANVDKQQTKALYRGKLSFYNPDIEKIKKYLWKENKDIAVSFIDGEGSPSWGLLDEKQLVKPLKYIEEVSFSADGHFRYINNYLDFTYIDNEPSQSENAPNCKLTVAEAKKTALDFMDVLGIHNFCVVDVKAQQANEGEKGLYYVFLTMDIENIPFEDRALTGKYFVPTVVMSISDEGIISCEGTPFIETIDTIELTKVLTFDAIIKNIRKVLGKEYISHPTIPVSNISIKYISEIDNDGEICFEPCWCFKYDDSTNLQNGGVDFSGNFSVTVDTGAVKIF